VQYPFVAGERVVIMVHGNAFFGDSYYKNEMGVMENNFLRGGLSSSFTVRAGKQKDA
jgi:hypothetical protein